MNKPTELLRRDHTWRGRRDDAQQLLGSEIRVSLIVEGIRESTLLTISESVDEPVFIAGESWTLCVPVGRDELILHNGGLPF
jgi:hypothetical protein